MMEAEEQEGGGKSDGREGKGMKKQDGAQVNANEGVHLDAGADEGAHVDVDNDGDADFNAACPDEFERERAVGITEFVDSNSTGFFGILKHRFSDFKVAEIGLDGRVACISDQLCDQSLLAKSEKGTSVEEVTVESVREAISPIVDDEGFILALYAFSQKQTKEVEQMSSPPLESKESRTKIHQAVRSLFGGLLQTEAVGSEIVIYHKRDAQKDKKRRHDYRNAQQPDQHRYLEFSLYKENMDTIDAIQLLARRLHINSKDFSYAGTKDRRGVTVQKVVARNVTPNKILGINKLFESTRLRVSDIRLAQASLSLGDLSGNRFTLIIRDIQGPPDGELAKMVERFVKHGFINYFGLQRFGTGAVSSYRIGTALLKGNWKGAIDLILSPRAGEGDERAIEARKRWAESGNAHAAYPLFPHRYTAERQILAHFMRDTRNQNDHLGAILSINRELRLMYVHSVQSLIWNRVASRRFRELGGQLVVGDLVSDRQGGETQITQSNIGLFSAEDLVLPLPGHQTVYPDNVVSSWYEQELEMLELGGPEAVKQAFAPKIKALWDLSGAYRKVFIKPGNLEYRVGYYADPNQDLDFACLRESSEAGVHRGMCLEFSLPSSCYATMAIRELLHTTTDPQKHKERTKTHQTVKK